jgi:hypothetical protein
MGRTFSLASRRTYEAFAQPRDDHALLVAVSLLAEEFGKDRPSAGLAATAVRREELELICFEYVTS